jgi:hypothetical protein
MSKTSCLKCLSMENLFPQQQSICKYKIAYRIDFAYGRWFSSLIAESPLAHESKHFRGRIECPSPCARRRSEIGRVTQVRAARLRDASRVDLFAWLDGNTKRGIGRCVRRRPPASVPAPASTSKHEAEAGTDRLTTATWTKQTGRKCAGC